MQALKFGPSYTSSDLGWDAQRTVNLIPEIDDTGEAKSGMNLRLITAPGTVIEKNVQTGHVVRGMCQLSNGHIVVVTYKASVQQSFVSVYKPVDNTLTQLQHALETDPVAENGWNALSDSKASDIRFAHNGIELLIVDAGVNIIKVSVVDAVLGTYNWSYAYDGPQRPFDAVDCAFIGGYFVVATQDTASVSGFSDKFYVSGLYEATFDPLDVATTEYKADGLVAVGALAGSLWLFGNRTLEIWAVSGDVDFPFSRIMGATSDTGILNRASLQQLADAFFWLACTSGGRPFIAMSNGYTPVKVSTTAIDTQLASVTDWSGVSSFTYSYAGHYYYGLNVPVLNTTFVYDLHSKMWHERTGYNSSTGGQTTVGYSHTSPSLTTEALVYKYSAPGIFKLDHGTTLLKTVTEPAGTELVCSRVFPIVSAPSGNRLRHDSVVLDASAGDTANQPAYTLQWSDDSGRTFNAGRTLQPADVGEYNERFIWRRLGTARHRLYKLMFTTAKHVSLRSVMVDVEALSA